MSLFELVNMIVAFLSLLAGVATLMARYQVTGWKYRMAMIAASLSVHLLVVVWFSMELVALGKGAASGTFRPGLTDSMLLYPHLVFFPLFLGYLTLFFLWLASELVWQKDPKYVLLPAIFSIVIGAAATYLENSGEAMMLLEFRQGAFRQAGFTEEDKAVFREVEAFLKDPEQAPPPAPERLGARERLFSFDQTWAGREEWSSKARPAYLLDYFYVISQLVYSLCLALAFVKSAPNMRRYDFRSYCYFMMATFGIYLLWVPCRMFYNVKVKGPVFGASTLDSFFGVKLPPFLRGVTSSEIAPTLIILIFLGAFSAINLLKIRERKTRLILFLGFIGLVFAVSCALALVWPGVFAQIYGLGAGAKYIIGRLIFVSLILWAGYCFVVSDAREGTVD